jgi:hypothetical protein
MLDLNFLQNTEFFKTRTLEKNEYLFKEWEIDENIYIIVIWELIIEKFIDKNKQITKKLAILTQNEVFWEASLNNNFPKQVSIKAKTKTKLIYINAKNLDDFNKKYPEIALNLLKYIIFLSNNRLNLSNKLITVSYTISQEIINLKDFSYKSIFALIEKIKNIANIEDIKFLEENPVLKEYLTIKYDTKFPWVMQDKIIKIPDNQLDLLNSKIKWIYNYIQKLQIWNKNYWYLIFEKKDFSFSENEKKIFSTLATSFAWVLKQKEFLKEQLNKEYMKSG